MAVRPEDLTVPGAAAVRVVQVGLGVQAEAADPAVQEDPAAPGAQADPVVVAAGEAISISRGQPAIPETLVRPGE